MLKACRREAAPYTPIWLMRQAGRYMPEYRRVRERHGFLEMCKRPELAAEVTVTAVERLKVDAAIIFADILLPLIPMEVGLHFEKGDGPVIDRPIRTEADLERIPAVDVAALGFVGDAIKLVHRAIGATTPLIGFAGAPFTLASYLIEGGSSRQYQATKTFMYMQPETWHRLMERLARTTADYLKMQIAAGADIVQIFDSWVGSLGPDDYRRFVLPHTASVIAAIPADVPVIHFGTVTGNLLELMREAGGDVIGLDWRVDLAEAWARLNYSVAVQGNLDPIALFADVSEIRTRARAILDQAGGRPGHIFNLGHGILPGDAGRSRNRAGRCGSRDERALTPMTAKAKCDAVLMIGFGGPTRADQVRPFLDNVLRGRPIPRERYEEVVHHYDLLGGRSPYNDLTMRQAAALREELAKKGARVPVAVGMAKWEPYVADSIRALARRWSAARARLHHGGASQRSQLRALPGNRQRRARCIGRSGARGRVSRAVARPSAVHRGGGVAHARGVRAAGRASAAARAADLHRAQYSARDGAGRAVRRAACAVGADGRRGAWDRRLAIRISKPQRESARGRGSNPTSRMRLRSLEAKPAVVVPIGFLCDHVEVLYDLDIEAAQIARAAGIRMERAPTVGDHPLFIEMMASIIAPYARG